MTQRTVDASTKLAATVSLAFRREPISRASPCEECAKNDHADTKTSFSLKTNWQIIGGNPRVYLQTIVPVTAIERPRSRMEIASDRRGRSFLNVYFKENDAVTETGNPMPVQLYPTRRVGEEVLPGLLDAIRAGIELEHGELTLVLGLKPTVRESTFFVAHQLGKYHLEVHARIDTLREMKRILVEPSEPSHPDFVSADKIAHQQPLQS